VTEPLKRGDLVVLRSPTEILATLDETGALDRMPFMPEMLGYYGRVHQVSARAERACDAATRARRVPATVMLEGVRCDGRAHDGCDAGCLIFWKEAWLRPVEPGEAVTLPRHDDAYEQLRALAARNIRPGRVSESGLATYRCQATEVVTASELIPYWNVRSWVRELTSGNVGLLTFVRVLAGIVVNEPRRRFRGPQPFRVTGGHAPSTPPVGLQAGSKVRVRSADEIADTLDDASKLRGLWFDREMVPFCGKTTTVRKRVERFISEKTGEMVELKSDCYILDGVYCKGLISDGRWFCPRQINLWWREAWLEPVADGAPGSTKTPS
jgi:hypothetical protein